MKTKQLFSKTLCTAMFAAAMAFGSSAVFAQVKIGTNPTTINAANNLEVEASGGSKVSVDKTTGKVTIADGSQGDLRILTSDATGVATWRDLKSTGIFAFSQTPAAGVLVNLPSSAAPVCGTLACATYLNWSASFTTAKNINDVVIDLTGNYNMAFSTTSLQFAFYLAVDKTTPGVFETVGSFFVTETGLACVGNYFNYKSVLQNLPARTYTVRVYVAPWVNGGAAAKLGIGTPSNPGSCGGPSGADLTGSQKLIVSVSQ